MSHDRNLELFRMELLDPLKLKVHRERDAAAKRKATWDAARVKQLPPAVVLRSAISDAMLDLDTIWELCRDDSMLPWQVKRAVNVIMMGLVYTNSYAGRPGEWEACTRERAEGCLSGGDDNPIVFESHKTERQFGQLGRFVPPGNAVAMRKVLDLHRHGAELFFDPPKSTAKQVNADDLLRRFGAVYTPGYQHPGATLQRKFFHGEAADEGNSEKSLGFLCDADGHKKKTGRRYVLPNPKSDCIVTKSAFENYAFKHVPWPSEEELADGRAESIERLRANFYKKIDVTMGHKDGGECSTDEDNSDTPVDKPKAAPVKVESKVTQGHEPKRKPTAPRKKKNGRGAFTEEQLDLIVAQCQAAVAASSSSASSSCSSSLPVPESCVLKHIVQSGLADGTLPPGTTVGQVRQVARRSFPLELCRRVAGEAIVDLDEDEAADCMRPSLADLPDGADID